MSNLRHTAENALHNLTESARSLVNATSGVTNNERVVRAREQLGCALDSSRDLYDLLQRKTREHAASTDRQIRENPYPVAALAFGLGVLLAVSLLLKRR